MLRRLWKLGSVKDGVFPTQSNLASLGKAISDCKDNKKDPSDIINGPYIEVIQLDPNPEIEDFLVEDIDVDGDEMVIKARKIK